MVKQTVFASGGTAHSCTGQPTIFALKTGLEEHHTVTMVEQTVFALKQVWRPAHSCNGQPNSLCFKKQNKEIKRFIHLGCQRKRSSLTSPQWT
jgi:hypothetical protein